jgi:hypothetical protein
LFDGQLQIEFIARNRRILFDLEYQLQGEKYAESGIQYHNSFGFHTIEGEELDMIRVEVEPTRFDNFAIFIEKQIPNSISQGDREEASFSRLVEFSVSPP